MPTPIPGRNRFLFRFLLILVFAGCCWGGPVEQFYASIPRPNSTGDYGQGVAVDANGNTYVAGTTNARVPGSSTDTPDAFVAKVDPLGNVLWTVTFGGSGYDSATSMARDQNGNLYIAGVTYSRDFPVKGSMQGFQGAVSCTGTTIQAGCSDAFVVKMDSTGAILYASYLGGTGDDGANGIAVGNNGNVYVTGSTSSQNFPLQNPIQASFGGMTDAFVAEINAAGNALVYSTYLGGSAADQGNGIALDTFGNAYIAGQTSSTNFPTQNPCKPNAGAQDCFITKINAAGTALVYSTYFGGSAIDYAGGIAVDSSGNAYIAANTGGGSFPISNLLSPLTPPQVSTPAAGALVAVKLNSSGSAYIYSTSIYYSTDAGGIAVDAAGNASITGISSYYAQGGTIVKEGMISILNSTGAALTFTYFAAGGVAVVTDSNGDIAAAGYDTNSYPVPEPTRAIVSRFTTQPTAGCTFVVTSISPQSFNFMGGSGTVTLDASAPACVPAVSSDSAWLTIEKANSTVVSFYVMGADSTRVGTLTIAGHPVTITQTVPTTSQPVSVSPETGSGAQQTFTATYSNASSVLSVYIMVSSYVQPQSSCFAEYDPGTNQFRLIADNGSSVSVVSPGSGSASNSQCTLSGLGASATTVGNNLSVTFPLSFTVGYVGAKNVFLFALSTNNQNTWWQQEGIWTVTSGIGGGVPPGAIPVCNAQGFPCVASLTPANGSGLTGTFTGVFTHSGGASQHYLGYILFLPTPNIVQYTATGSCLVEYNRISNAMRLINDAGTDWLPGIIGLPVGQTGSLTNSHCTLNVGQSSGVINGTTMTVTAAMTFNSGFSGKLATFMQGFDVTGAYTGMTQFGNWMASAGGQAPGPYIVGVSPQSGAGSSTTLTFTAGHTSGVPSLSFVTLLISSVIVGGTPCQAFYFPAANVLNLVNDSGTAMVSANGIAPGTAGSLANSRCTINTGTASRNVSGNNVSVSLPLTFNTATFAGPQNVYVNAFDNFGYLSHWGYGGNFHGSVGDRGGRMAKGLSTPSTQRRKGVAIEGLKIRGLRNGLAS